MVQDKRKILFVGGISAILTEEQIQRHFSKHCKVAKVRIMREKKTYEPKGFAFVTLADSSEVQSVLEKTHIIEGRKVDVQLASRKGEKKNWKEEQKKKRLFVSNLPEGVTNEELASFFSKYGEVRNAYIIRDYLTDQSKNYGYIEFKDTGIVPIILKEEVTIQSLKITCLPYVGRHEPKTKEEKALHSSDEDPNSTEIIYTKKEKSACSVDRNQRKEVIVTESSPKAIAQKQLTNEESKYEYIGMSSKLNEDESNYNFTIGKRKTRSRPAMLSPGLQEKSKCKLENAVCGLGSSIARFKWLKSLKSQPKVGSSDATNSAFAVPHGCSPSIFAPVQACDSQEKKVKPYWYFKF